MAGKHPDGHRKNMKRYYLLLVAAALLMVATVAATSERPVPTVETSKYATPFDEILNNLEPTGNVVIRHLRVPADGDKPARLIRFQVPVYRERKPSTSGQPSNQTVIDATVIR